jgi:uncharacterized protein (DUF3084 family)
MSLEWYKSELAAKVKELNEIYATIQDIKDAYETLKLVEQKKDLELDSYKSQITMKDSQMTTISSIIRTKDQQIEAINSTIKMKDDQIFAMNQTLDAKTTELKSLKESKAGASSSEVKVKDDKIAKLEEELKILNMDLKVSDEEIEKLNEKIKKGNLGQGSSGNSEIITKTVTRDQLINFMITMLKGALHNVNLTTPTIADLADLQLYDIRGSVNVKASCDVEVNNTEHQQLLHEFEALDNISVRQFPDKDRWVCLKDGEEMLIAAVGEQGHNLAFFSKDRLHIKLFNSLIMESWLRARKM